MPAWPLSDLLARIKARNEPLKLSGAAVLDLPCFPAEGAARQHLCQPQPLGELLSVRVGSGVSLRCAAHAGSGFSGAARGTQPTVQLAFPCALRPAVGPKGLELQLQLFQLRVGDPDEWPRPPPRQAAASPHWEAASLTAAALDRAAGLLACRLLFPDEVLPVLPLLASAYAASLAVQAASLLVSPAARAAARRRLRRARQWQPLVTTASSGALVLGSLIRDFGQPACVLLVAAVLWTSVHPSSAQIGECIAALIPVMAGYNQAARECAVRGLSGAPAEELWRAKHKWAARRTAALLGDLPDEPPLAGLVSAWEALSICAGATFQGRHFGGLAGCHSSSGAWQLWLTAGVRSQRSRQEQRGRLDVAAGHMAAPSQPGEGQPDPAAIAAVEQHQRRQQLEAVALVAVEQAGGSRIQPSSPEPAVKAARQPQPAAGEPSTSAPALHVDAPGTPPASSGDAAGRSHGRASVLDSPSEMWGGSSPLNGWQPDAVAWPPQGPDAPQGPAGQDFMHPSRWAAARDAGESGVRGGGGSIAGSSITSHSFLLPGRTFSSGSSGGGSARGGDTGAALPPGLHVPAAAPAAALGQPAALPQDPAAAAAAALAEPAEVLPLYGRGDHSVEDARLLTPGERLQLAARAVQLLALFAPFILLGSAMLLLAAQLDSWAGRRRVREVVVTEVATPAAAVTNVEAVEEEEAVGSPTAERLRTAAFKLLLGACRRSGAAFIKWGQWASTREDIFPPAFCSVLSELHDRAPTHSFAQTRRIVEAELGGTLERFFISFEPQALASGSIAQVHRARMLVDGQPHEVAVKVRHPGVAERIWQDFQLLRPLAAATARVRSLRSLNLSDSVSQFSHTMTAQADLRVEAAHLRRFFANFASVTSSVHVPRPYEGFCTAGVLVESYEPGRSVAHFIRNPHPQNTQIVALGVDTYLKMLLQDNFVHTDLHPGNILVRDAARNGNHTLQQLGGGVAGSEAWRRLELVLLDFGLAEELTPAVRHHFISFLHMIAKGDGRHATRHLLRWSTRQRCPDPVALMADMEALFRERCNIHSAAGINLDAVMKAVLHLARRHEVSIDSSYAALVIGVCVIVGFAASLDARLNLMDAAAPCFLYHALTGRVSGRLYM